MSGVSFDVQPCSGWEGRRVFYGEWIHKVDHNKLIQDKALDASLFEKERRNKHFTHT